MGKIYCRALDQHLEVERVIDRIEGEQDGPCIVFFAGVHGNEPSGVFALHQVFQELKTQNIAVNGSIYALAGNLRALERSERFEQTDLNRLWDRENLARLESTSFEPDNQDEKEQLELYQFIQNLLSTQSGPFYFFDLHTTSSQTIPFLTVNDSLLNREFTQQYPAPMILGIEEYLDGPLLSYINELGYVSFGFEAGQHDDISSVNNHIAFTYLSLVFSGAIEKKSIDFDHYFQSLGELTRNFYEIYYRREIDPDEEFQMEPGFANFQRVKKGQLLSRSNNQPVLAPEDAIIFMPLYQPQGDDGFFLIRRIPMISLRISAILRKWRFDRLLPLLPGVRRSTTNSDTLLVNLRVARLLTKQILHLLGYRSKKMDQTHLIVRSRETHSKTKDYQGAGWYTNSQYL